MRKALEMNLGKREEVGKKGFGTNINWMPYEEGLRQAKKMYVFYFIFVQILNYFIVLHFIILIFDILDFLTFLFYLTSSNFCSFFRHKAIMLVMYNDYCEFSACEFFCFVLVHVFFLIFCL